MTSQQRDQFRIRSRIETVWGIMKERFQLVYNLSRSSFGLFRHYFYSIAAFMLFGSKNRPILA